MNGDRGPGPRERFELLTPLRGDGLFETVSAYDSKLRRRVRLHVLPAAPDAEVSERLERLLRAVARGACPNAVPVVDSWSSGDRRFIVTEAVLPSETLARLEGEVSQDLAWTLSRLGQLVADLERAGLGDIALDPEALVLRCGQWVVDPVLLVRRAPRCGPLATRESYFAIFERMRLRSGGEGAPELASLLAAARRKAAETPLDAFVARVERTRLLGADRNLPRLSAMLALLLALDALVPPALELAGLTAFAQSTRGAVLWAFAEYAVMYAAFHVAQRRDCAPGLRSKLLFRLTCFTLVARPLGAIGLALLGKAPALLPSLEMALRAAAVALLATRHPKLGFETALLVAASIAAAHAPWAGMSLLGLTQALAAATLVLMTRDSRRITQLGPPRSSAPARRRAP